jgi:uncharacterized membrane protein YfcA
VSLAAPVALGVLIGITLGALGGGGSILAVPVLVHLAGQSAGAATATSLVAVGAASTAAAVRHARAGRVRWNAAGLFVVTGVPGSWLGAAINARLDGDVLLLVFSGFVMVAAHRMLTACPSCTRVGGEAATADPADTPRQDPVEGPVDGTRRWTDAVRRARTVTLVGARQTGAPNRRIALVVATGTLVGFLTGLFGVGGGFVIVPALTLALGLAMPTAIGTSLAVIVGNAAVALGIRGLDAVDWGLTVPFTATMLAGSVAGAAGAHLLPPRRSLDAFAAILVLVAVANAAAALIGLYT